VAGVHKLSSGGLRIQGQIKKPLLSVVTVVYNGQAFIEHTIQSVLQQEFSDFEYIIIDGGSTDETINIIKKYEDKIDYWISEPDNGIYDAMNKAVKIAKGQWLNFLNAGDRFVNNSVLKESFAQKISDKIDLIYSDWFLCDLRKDPIKLFPGYSDYSEGKILHQSVIYKKNLHDKYGIYLVTPKLIISDYIFIYLIPEKSVYKSKIPISINDNTGVSCAGWSFQQKMAVDFILRRSSFKDYIKILVNYTLYMKEYSFKDYMKVLINYKINKLTNKILPQFIVQYLKKLKCFKKKF
jgi:glycosyltransferase involved in cell wall biosynthesis